MIERTRGNVPFVRSLDAVLSWAFGSVLGWEVYATVTCPACNIGAWPDKTRGIRVCPNCATVLRLTKKGVFVASSDVTARFGRPALNPSRPKFPQSAGGSYKSRANTYIHHVIDVDGRIACASCAQWTTFLGSIDGHLDGDGLMRVDRAVRDARGIQIGVETVYIPANVRGRFCAACAATYPVRAIGRLTVPPSRFTLDYPVTASLAPFKPRSGRKADAPQTWRYSVEKQADIDPTWAHTFDATWLSCSTPGKVFGREDTGDASEPFRLEPVGKHPLACGCHKCKRHEPNSDWIARVFTASVHSANGPARGIAYISEPFDFGPIVSVPPRVERYRVSLPESVTAMRARSANRAPWLIGTEFRHRPSDVETALRICIAHGWADRAGAYARLLARQALAFPRIGPLAARVRA